MFASTSHVNAEGDSPSGEDRRCLADVFRRALGYVRIRIIRECRRRQARGGFSTKH